MFGFYVTLRWVGGCMCVVGEKKIERQGGTWVVGKKKKMGSKVYGYGGKKWGSGKERRKKI